MQKLEEDLSNSTKDKEQASQNIVTLEKEKKAFAANKKFKDAARCQQELKDLNSKVQSIDTMINKTIEHKGTLIVDLDDKKLEVEELGTRLAETQAKIQENDILGKFFRKEEITDLITAVERLDETNNENANEFNIKKEKL